MPYYKNTLRGIGDIEDARDNKADTHPSVNPAVKKHRSRKRVGMAGKLRVAVKVTKQSPKRTSRKRVTGK